MALRKTSIVRLNPHTGNRLPAAALQNMESACAGTVNVTATRPCIELGTLENTKPSVIALMIGNGKAENELQINTIQ